MIKIIYFGRLQDELGIREETLNWSNGTTEALKKQLQERGDNWQDALSDKNLYKVAINRHIIHHDTPIPEGAEVAFLPPVSGG